MEKLVMEVKDYLAINKAKIEINKINVVGGVNGSGKSTLSRIFYSLLKGNSTKRRDYALQSLIDDINETIDNLDYEGNEYHFPKHLKINYNYPYIIRKYNEVLKIYEKHERMAEIKIIELTKEMDEILNNLMKKLENNGFDVKELKSDHKLTMDDNFLSYFSEDVAKAFKDHDNFSERLFPVQSFCFEMAKYENVFDNYFFSIENDFLLSEEMQEYIKDIKRITDLNDQWLDLFNIVTGSDMDFPILDIYFKRRWEVFFQEDSPILSMDCLSEIFTKEHIFDKRYAIEYVYGINFELYLNLIDSKIDAFDYFFQNGFISSVYYVDNLSLIDLLKIKDKNFQLFHNYELIEDLYKKEGFEINIKSDIFQNSKLKYGLKEELNLNQDVKNILERIENIICGSYENYGPYFSSDKKIKDQFSMGGISIGPYSTASGIKQIGIIQLLLMKNKLVKDGYLIIDEPEVNLHPDWQFKFAEILVLLAKDLNITIYLNSHSPFFIEAIDAFTEFYDMSDYINYYWTEESEVEGKYNFTKIESDELYKIYGNLGNAYDLINQLRLRKRLEK